MIFSNLAGTMSDSFAIGKRGVKLLQGTEAPTSALVAPIGSLYLLKSGVSIRVYQLVAAETWEPLLTAGSIPFLVTRSDANVPNAVTFSTTGSLDFSPSTGILKISNNPVFAGQLGLVPPKGSTAQRGNTPAEGIVRYNTETKTLELYDNTSWKSVRVDANPSATSYTQTFTSADVVEGKITVTHNLNQKLVMAAVFDNSDSQVMPTGFRLLNANQVEFDVTAHVITGTWSLIIKR